MSAIPAQASRIRTIILARLFIATFFLFYAQYVFRVDSTIFYGIIAVTSILSAVYLIWFLSKWQLKALNLFQIFADLIWESILVYYTGGADSLFAPIYVLSILSAGILILPATSFYVAIASSVCFIGIAACLYSGIQPFQLPLPDPTLMKRQDIFYLFYATYVRVTVFFIVAWLTYYFARSIQRLEDRMKAQERLAVLGEILSDIAHEIRNPLASISGSIELLSQQLKTHLNEKQTRLMDAVVDESERIKRIFSGLLDYSRMNELQYETISIPEFLDQIILLIQHQEGFNREIGFDCRYKTKNMRLVADPEQLKQAIMNIVMNAVQAMPTGGIVTVDTIKQGEEIKIMIKDTGEGIDKKMLKQLFVPFKTTKKGGTGLGMAQAHRVVSQHGGRIQVQSKQKVGTQVEIFVPANGA